MDVRTGHPVPAVTVLAAVLNERTRQDQLKKEGRFEYTCTDLELTEFQCLAVLMEEVGEASRSILRRAKLTHDGAAEEETTKHLVKELTQIAAIATAMMQRYPEAFKEAEVELGHG